MWPIQGGKKCTFPLIWFARRKDTKSLVKKTSARTSLGEGNGNPFQYPCLENPMGGGAWWAAVRGVVKSGTRLRDFTFTFHFHALKKEMATHSCSFLENPRDGGAWWAAVYRISQSKTQLKQLSSSSSSSRTSQIQWLRLYTPSSEDLGWIPGQGTRMLQLKKILHAATKIQCSQMNK